MLSRTFRILCIAAVALLGACASYPPAPPTASSADYRYVIGPGDTLQIVVFRQPELSTTVPVRPDGRVAVPLVDDIPAIGKDPATLARAIKIAGGVISLAVAAFVGLKGELAVAIPLGIFGAGLLGWSPFQTTGFGNIGTIFGGGGQRSPGQDSRVRSQFFEIILDHDSGTLTGRIVAGPHAGHSLD